MATAVSYTSSAVSESQIASTLPHLENVIRDNVSDTTPLLSFLMGGLGRSMRFAPFGAEGAIEGNLGTSLPGVIVGGRDIMVPVQLLQNQTPGSYSGADTIDITHQDTDRRAIFPIRQNAGSLVITGREMRANKGEAAIYNLMQSKTMRLVQDMREQMAAQAVSDGTGNSGKDMEGLASIVSTGTLAGIAPGTYPRWQPGGYASGDGRHGIIAEGGAFTVSNAQILFNNLVQGTDGPDMVMTAKDAYEFYETDLLDTTGQIAYSNLEVGDKSFVHLKFRNTPVMFDHAIPDGLWYALNSRHIAFERDRDANFTWMNGGANPVDQDVFVRIMIVEGNIVTDNRRMLGALNTILS